MALVTLFAPTGYVGPFPAFPLHAELAYYPEGTDVDRWDVELWAGAPTYPTVTGTLAARYDASNAGSITDAGAGAVSAWNDLSGNARHLTQGTGGSRPTTGTRTSPTGLNWLDFDGTADHLSSSAFTRNQPATVFAVFANDDGANAAQQRLVDCTLTGGGAAFQKNTADAWETTHGTALAGGTADTAAHVAAVVVNGASSSLRIDGTVAASGNSGTNNPTGGIRVGCNPGATQNFWDGPVGEVIWYSGVLSGADIAALEAYLRAKWIAAPAGAGSWEGAPPVDDVSCNVIAYRSRSGRDLPLERFRAATATLEILDPTGAYSPWATLANAAAYTTIRPGIDVRVWVETPGGPVDRFSGFVDSIVDSWAEIGGESTHTVTLSCFDYLAVLAAYDGTELPAVGAGELAGARISRIATNAGYGRPTNLDAGTVPLQATTLAKNAADEIGIVVDTETGAAWVDPSGVLQFRDRNGLVTDPHYSTVQATFGELAGEICYGTIEPATDLSKVKNVVGIANVGGTMTTVSDLASISLYGRRTYRRTDLVNVNGSDNAVIAQRHLDAYAYAASRIDKLELDLRALTDAQRETVIELDLLWRVQVRRRATGFQIVADLQIQSLAETITATDWRITLGTFSAAVAFTVGRWNVDKWDSGKWGY